jgi:hypothetical protein
MNEQNIPQPNLEAIESMLKSEIRRKTNAMVKRGPTPSHGNKSRGVGITRKNKEETTAKKHNAKLQRAVNRARKNKKFRPTGSKQRK